MQKIPHKNRISSHRITELAQAFSFDILHLERCETWNTGVVFYMIIVSCRKVYAPSHVILISSWSVPVCECSQDSQQQDVLCNLLHQQLLWSFKECLLFIHGMSAKPRSSKWFVQVPSKILFLAIHCLKEDKRIFILEGSLQKGREKYFSYLELNMMA